MSTEPSSEQGGDNDLLLCFFLNEAFSVDSQELPPLIYVVTVADSVSAVVFQ